MTSNPARRHWAILVGINFYRNEKQLEGCVRDVENIRQYLSSGPTSVNISAFTASKPCDPNGSNPAEDEESWPTYENLMSTFAEVSNNAERGDYVYFHYSGHGTRWTRDRKNRNTGDLALVLFDKTCGARLLRGQKLADQMRNFVDRGVFVTIVLDCCFSGSAIRDSDPAHSGIRYTEYNPAIHALYPEDIESSQYGGLVGSPRRGACLVPDWLVDPKGYTILTACGPHETAQELTVDEGEKSERKHGALSYFLVDALASLRRNGTDITHHSLYQHLCVQFHASWPKQNPMRYGENNICFFGELKSADTGCFSVLWMDGLLYLGAGRAHGVYQDDEYVLDSLYTSEDVFNNPAHVPVKVQVSSVQSLGSNLVAVDGSSLEQVMTGWKARPLSGLGPRKVPVWLMPEVTDRDQWIPVAEQRNFLNVSVGDNEGRPYLFNVGLNEHGQYEILDASCQNIPSLPSVPADKAGAMESIMGLLEHLATFKYFEAIENRIPNAHFVQSFALRLSDVEGHYVDASGRLNAKHGDKLTLVIENYSDKPLYLVIFDLGPSWQIDNILSKPGQGDYRVVPPKDEVCSGKDEIRLEMRVPDAFVRQGRCDCEDIIKVFTLSKPTSFAPLVLPEISSAERSNTLVRGGNRQTDFISGLTRYFRGAKDGDLDDNWTATNFLVHTRV